MNNLIYIVTSNVNLRGNPEPIKIFDFNKQIINEIKNSNEDTFFIDSYYDNNLSKYFIITGNNNFSRSYDYEKNNIYHKYKDRNLYAILSLIIKYNNGICKMIESCSDGNIRIYNFHSGLLLNKIKINNSQLYGIYLRNDDHLFVGCEDKTIKIVEIKSGLIINSLTGHNNRVLTIKKIIHPKYGECLISQNYKHSELKLWINEF